jgi:hypothetical protein
MKKNLTPRGFEIRDPFKSNSFANSKLNWKIFLGGPRGS